SIIAIVILSIFLRAQSYTCLLRSQAGRNWFWGPGGRVQELQPPTSVGALFLKRRSAPTDVGGYDFTGVLNRPWEDDPKTLFARDKSATGPPDWFRSIARRSSRL